MIAQVFHGNFGGSSRVACRLANALSRRGHGVHTVSYEPPPWTLEPAIVRQSLLESGNDMSATLYWDWTADDRDSFKDLLLSKLATENFDILHYHYAQPFAEIIGQIAVSLGERMPYTIGTLHGTDLSRCRNSLEALASLTHDLTKTDALTTVSQYMIELAKTLLPASLSIQVLPNFVEDDWPRGNFEDSDFVPSANRPVILHVSNFRAVKDVGLLARLFISIRRQADVELWLVGDGPEMPALRDLLEKSPAGAAVRYFGASTQPAEYFQKATILMSTSTEESFGLAVLEAMASGVAVVATSVGGIPELVKDNVTGILFDRQDFDETVTRVISLLRSPETFRGMRLKASRIAEPLRETSVIDCFENLYRTKRPAR